MAPPESSSASWSGEAGAIRAAIDKRFPLEEAAAAHAYVDTGERKGAVVLTMDEETD